MTRSSRIPSLMFGSPRHLPKAGKVEGRVVVVDIAFAAAVGSKINFASVTKPFIDGLGDRLAAWVDHHDHDRHSDFAGDSRFVLATKAQHGGCPEMITPEIVRHAGPVDTVLAHIDLDGLYSAAKWILGGEEPYSGADADARAVDTRIGEPGPIARRVDRALRGEFRDFALKRAVVHWLVAGRPRDDNDGQIEEAARVFEHREVGTLALAEHLVMRGRVNYVDARGASAYDKTDLLLFGQKSAPVCIVHDSGYITIAAGFDSPWNFVTLFGLDGGMPTRVTLPEKRLDEVLRAINTAG